MTSLAPDPRRGLSALEAFERWSDPEKLKTLVELAEATSISEIMNPNLKFRDADQRRELIALRDQLEDEFRERLINEEIFASGICESYSKREIIHPTRFELLFIDFSEDLVGGMGQAFEKSEFFTLDSIPLNVRPVPEWLDKKIGAAGLNVFRLNPDYQHFVLHGIEYAVSELHAKIVALLHQAWLANDPWQIGKIVLERAGSKQLKMGDVFKTREDWKAFIEFDGKRMYRLRMEPPKQL